MDSIYNYITELLYNTKQIEKEKEISYDKGYRQALYEMAKIDINTMKLLSEDKESRHYKVTAFAHEGSLEDILWYTPPLFENDNIVE